jgi:hypothetical protein
MNSSSSSISSKVNETHSKNHANGLVTINEKVNLTKYQHQVLKVICDMYQTSFSEYMQEALVEAMKFDRPYDGICTIFHFFSILYKSAFLTTRESSSMVHFT